MPNILHNLLDLVGVALVVDIPRLGAVAEPHDLELVLVVKALQFPNVCLEPIDVPSLHLVPPIDHVELLLQLRKLHRLPAIVFLLLSNRIQDLSLLIVPAQSSQKPSNTYT